MKKIIKHYQMTGRLIVTRGYIIDYLLHIFISMETSHLLANKKKSKIQTNIIIFFQ